MSSARASASGFPDCHQRLQILRVEHQQTEKVGARRLTGARASQQMSKEARQTNLEIGGESPDILRRPDQDEVNDPQAATFFRRQPREQVVDPRQVQRVAIVVVQEDGVQQLTGNLHRRRIPPYLRALRLVLRLGVSRRERQDPARPEVYRRRERSDETESLRRRTRRSRASPRETGGEGRWRPSRDRRSCGSVC